MSSAPGYRNRKAFLLFLLYTTLMSLAGGLESLLLLLDFFGSEADPEWVSAIPGASVSNHCSLPFYKECDRDRPSYMDPVDHDGLSLRAITRPLLLLSRLPGRSEFDTARAHAAPISERQHSGQRHNAGPKDVATRSPFEPSRKATCQADCTEYQPLRHRCA